MSSAPDPGSRPARGAATGWTFAAGNIPAAGTGHEPEFTSREELCLLNTGDGDACAQLHIYHSDREPVGPYRIDVPARRVRHIRLNDLIDPQAIPLGVPYAMVLTSDVPVVAQVRHLDTRRDGIAVAVYTGIPFLP